MLSYELFYVMDYFNQLWPYLLSFASTVLLALGACIVAFLNSRARKFDSENKDDSSKEGDSPSGKEINNDDQKKKSDDESRS